MAIEDLFEGNTVEGGEAHQVDQSGAIFRAPDGESDCGEVFGPHDPDPVAVPFVGDGIIQGLGLEVRGRTEELDRVVMDKEALLLEVAKTQFGKPSVERIE